MGLDQSIFTTSKTIAKAIHDGVTPNGKWSKGCFSPATLKGVDDWTRFDTYAQSRIAQRDNNMDATGFGWSVIALGKCNTNERRADTLKLIDELSIEGMMCECPLGNVPIYQVGHFRKFGFLNYVLEEVSKRDFESDEMVGMNANVLAFARSICQRALEAGIPDEYERGQAREFVDFADLVLSYPEARSALFFYNPWW